MSILPYIESFTAVVEKGSFTAAAKALGISKPVVSKQVSQLEKQLGVQLIRRTTRRLNLTEAGEIFARYTEKIVADAREAEDSVLPLQSEPQGKLRISAPESLAMSLLPAALVSFQQRYPKMELDVSISGRYVDLVQEGIDVALRIGELQDSSLIARRLMACEIQVCAAPEYWAKYGKPTHPNELRNHNCLIYSQSPKPDTWSFKEIDGDDLFIKVNGSLRSDIGGLLLDSAIEGQGVFLGPSYMTANAMKQNQLEVALEDYMRPSTALYAVFPSSKLVSSKVRAFVDHLVEITNDPI